VHSTRSADGATAIADAVGDASGEGVSDAWIAETLAVGDAAVEALADPATVAGELRPAGSGCAAHPANIMAAAIPSATGLRRRRICMIEAPAMVGCQVTGRWWEDA
jgi:hypothetical protein